MGFVRNYFCLLKKIEKMVINAASIISRAQGSDLVVKSRGQFWSSNIPTQSTTCAKLMPSVSSIDGRNLYISFTL
jgi:hypothetical protein